MSEVRRPTARDEHGLAVTCPASRHAQLIAEELIEHGSCGQLADEGKHAGQSILSAVRSLYSARAEIARLTAEVKLHRMTPEEWSCCLDCALDSYQIESSKEVQAYLERTKPKEESDA